MRRMVGNQDAQRTGVCVVRAEADASIGLRITVTTRPDVNHAAGESVDCSTSIDVAIARVAEFLRDFERGSG